MVSARKQGEPAKSAKTPVAVTGAPARSCSKRLMGEFVSGVMTDDGHEPGSERAPASRSPAVGEGRGDAALAERYRRPEEVQS